MRKDEGTLPRHILQYQRSGRREVGRQDEGGKIAFVTDFPDDGTGARDLNHVDEEEGIIKEGGYL
jgi:hypothetical protein